MKPAPFDYAAPASLEEALALKARHGDEAKFLAGGQSLIPAMNFRLAQTALLIDLNGLPGLDFVRQAGGGELRLGGLTRQRRLERDPLVAAHAPLLHETMPFVAHPQIRNRGTLGGSLAHADPAAELPVVAVALGARIRAQSVRGERWISSEDFFQGFFTTALAPDELLVEVALPPLPPRTGCAFTEFARRRGDYALAGVAAVVTLDEAGACRSAHLVYLNLGAGPVDARGAAGLLLGERPSEGVIAAAAEMAAGQEIMPLGSVHASPEYQSHLARVLTRRALEQAFERARSGGA
ncbi:MAG: xanthine dehydrogenase family protein subunit M [Chloroflexi bacterium]|nr:xanthine dehydrogenase family protein subunit M [Chloroflexota bacterium]